MQERQQKQKLKKISRSFRIIVNFGNDCRKNIGNCKLDLLYDGLNEISYIKKFTNVLNYDRFSELISIVLLKEQVISEYNEKIENLDEDDPFIL